jgi:excisionase family DNA binding protein
MDELLTVTEVAERLGCSPATIRYWIHTGKIEAVPLPTRGRYPRYRVRKAIVEAFEQQQKQQADVWEHLLRNS